MAKIGSLHKPKSANSKYQLTGIIYLMGLPVSIGVKKKDDGSYDIDSFGLVDKNMQKQSNNSGDL